MNYRMFKWKSAKEDVWPKIENKDKLIAYKLFSFFQSSFELAIKDEVVTRQLHSKKKMSSECAIITWSVFPVAWDRTKC